MSVNVKSINQWWQRALRKESQRASHHPKAPRGNRWAVVTRDKNVEPGSGKERE